MLDDGEIRNLLLRVAGRDTDAFGLLYRRAAPLLLGVALRIVGRREVAEEVVHDTFVKVWRSAGGFDPLAPQPVGWLVAIARNRAIDVVSSADTARVDTVGDDAETLLDRLFDWSTPADEALDGSRASRWLRTCMEALKPAERQAISLAYVHGMSHADLATHMQRPLGTVKAWVRRGLDSLRRCVEDAGGGR